jgi:hypothetical protein
LFHAKIFVAAQLQGTRIFDLFSRVVRRKETALFLPELLIGFGLYLCVLDFSSVPREFLLVAGSVLAGSAVKHHGSRILFSVCSLLQSAKSSSRSLLFYLMLRVYLLLCSSWALIN